MHGQQPKAMPGIDKPSHRNSDTRWPRDLRPETGEIFAHNQILIQAPCSVVWVHLIEAGLHGIRTPIMFVLFEVITCEHYEAMPHYDTSQQSACLHGICTQPRNGVRIICGIEYRPKSPAIEHSVVVG
jgi:hypothetical protein